MYFPKTPSLAKYLVRDAIWSISTEEKVIYLTFDDGPTPVITEWTLGILKEFDAKGTFFCLGKNIEQHPAIFRQIIREGHAIGNHTWDHPNGWKTSNREYFENIVRCEAEISNYMPHQKLKIKNQKFLFRPSYGKIKQSQLSYLKTKYSVIMWDVLSGDFDLSIKKENCFANVVNNAKKGSIVVFHDSEKAKFNLHYALPRVLEYYSAKGFRFETIN